MDKNQKYKLTSLFLKNNVDINILKSKIYDMYTDFEKRGAIGGYKVNKNKITETEYKRMKNIVDKFEKLEYKDIIDRYTIFDQKFKDNPYIKIDLDKPYLEFTIIIGQTSDEDIINVDKTVENKNKPKRNLPVELNFLFKYNLMSTFPKDLLDITNIVIKNPIINRLSSNPYKISISAGIWDKKREDLIAAGQVQDLVLKLLEKDKIDLFVPELKDTFIQMIKLADKYHMNNYFPLTDNEKKFLNDFYNLPEKKFREEVGDIIEYLNKNYDKYELPEETLNNINELFKNNKITELKEILKSSPYIDYNILVGKNKFEEPGKKFYMENFFNNEVANNIEINLFKINDVIKANLKQNQKIAKKYKLNNIL